MSTPQISVRLRPNESEFLASNSFKNGEIFYDEVAKTLVLCDGQTLGGFPLLRADLSNLSGGSSTAGDIDFGTKNIIANKFIGDGSELTNLPIPPDLATISYVDNAIANVTIGPATTTTLGTVKVGAGLSITPDGLLTADAVAGLTVLQNIQSFSFTTGATVTTFSTDGTFASNLDSKVPTEKAINTFVTSKIAAIDLTANGVIDTGLAQRLAFYAANGKTLSQTNLDLTWNQTTGTLSIKNASLSGTLGVTGKSTLNGGVDIVGNSTLNGTLGITGSSSITGTLVVEDSVKTPNIFDDSLGIFKITSGSDILFDVPGEINVNGTRIVGIPTPTDPDHVVNKAYVDGAASAFSGGDVANPIRILSTLTSTSTTTGALVVGGGGGFGGPIYATGNIFVDGSPVLTSLSGGYNGGTITGTVFINNTTASTSTGTGALRVSGGVGIGGRLNVGADIYTNGIRVGNGAAAGAGFLQNAVLGGGTGAQGPLGSNVSGVNNVAIGYSTIGQLLDGNNNIGIGHYVMANKLVGSENIAIGNDSLKDHSGFGNVMLGHLAGAFLLSGDNNVIIGGNTGTDIDGTNNNVILADGQGNIKLWFNINGALKLGSTFGTAGDFLVSGGENSPISWGSASDLRFNGGAVANSTQFEDTLPSTSTTTGAVTIVGGLGVGGSIYAGGIQSTPIGSVTRSNGAFTTLTANSSVTFTANTASTNTTTGSLVVTGGVGITGALNAGGAIRFTQNVASTDATSGTLVVTGGIGVSASSTFAGAVKIVDETVSAGTNTGALTVTGGVGVGGALNVGGLIAATGAISTQSNITATGTANFGGTTVSSLTISGLATFQQLTELVTPLTGATGIVTHNLNGGAIFLHTSPAADFTANFTNVPTTENRSVTVALVVVQGATARRPTAVQINGTAQTLNWFGNTVPTGTANRTDVFTFNLIRAGGAWRVLGAGQGF